MLSRGTQTERKSSQERYRYVGSKALVELMLYVLPTLNKIDSAFLSSSYSKLGRKSAPSVGFEHRPPQH